MTQRFLCEINLLYIKTSSYIYMVALRMETWRLENLFCFPALLPSVLGTSMIPKD